VNINRSENRARASKENRALSLFVFLLYHVFPVAHELHELHVHVEIVLGKQCEVLLINLLKQRVHIDALHQLSDLEVKLHNLGL